VKGIMDRKYLPVHTTVLDCQALLERVLTRYPLSSPLTCRLFSNGLNDVYVVNNGAATCFLRVSKSGWRSRQDIEEEIDLVSRLYRQDIRVALPIGSRDGSYIQDINAYEGIRYAVLFSNAEGDIHDITENRQNRAFGKIVGRMHRAFDQIENRYRRSHIDKKTLLEQPVARIARFLKHRPGDFEYLQEIADHLKDRLDGLPRTRPRYGLCHGDLHAGNVRFDQDGRPTLFDFDFSGCSWRAYDIAAYVHSMVFSQQLKDKKFDWKESFAYFLLGYNEENSVSTRDLNMVNAFVVIRHIWALGLQVGFSRYKGMAMVNDEFFDNNLELMKKTIRDFKIL
jgi:Ser/Thr protein kinase RdoA (MazF antagonist)